MLRFIEQLIVAIWNRLQGRPRGARSASGSLDLGFRVQDEQVTNRRVALSQVARSTHVTILGKTGTGKSSLVKHLLEQDVRAGRGFLVLDIHGEFTPFVLSLVNSIERQTHVHQDDKLLLIDPADALASVGLNPFEQEQPDFVHIAEFAEILKRRWSLDGFGAQTDELLRNGLYILASAHLTILELPLVLTDSAFRATHLNSVDNPEVRQYFELRFDRASDAMRAKMAEPVLNKITAFTADPRFRLILGQSRSTFSILDALDKGYWVVVNLDKGRLGEQSATLGSLIFSMAKNAIFARQSRKPFSIYCDEIQNYVGFAGAIETILSESRKKGVSLVSACQYLGQTPPEMRAAILSTGNQTFFQLSPPDATQIGQALDGGKPLAEHLKNLPQRHAIVKSGSDRLVEIRVPDVRQQRVDYTNLLHRCRGRWARPKQRIEQEIAARQKVYTHNAEEDLE